jgi:hypothetical protein
MVCRSRGFFSLVIISPIKQMWILLPPLVANLFAGDPEIKFVHDLILIEPAT